MTIEKLSVNAAAQEIARKAVEDELIWRRDARIAVLRNNGLVCKEKDGTPSEIIRMGFEEALVVGIKAILAQVHALAPAPREPEADSECPCWIVHGVKQCLCACHRVGEGNRG